MVACTGQWKALPRRRRGRQPHAQNGIIRRLLSLSAPACAHARFGSTFPAILPPPCSHGALSHRLMSLSLANFRRHLACRTCRRRSSPAVRPLFRLLPRHFGGLAAVPRHRTQSRRGQDRRPRRAQMLPPPWESFHEISMTQSFRPAVSGESTIPVGARRFAFRLEVQTRHVLVDVAT